MHYMGLNEIREKFLSFFESKGHLRLPSFPLIPKNDKSLLLINSGMAPMKKYFTGEEEPPCHRVTTCQKCIRTPDLERVGHTARHGTYFEMLGNFSFGDYFKNEAIPWAWEFLTRVMEIPADRLWPSVYEKDDEAYAIWRDVIGVPEERIVRLGKEDNFWEHGSGPCGPCSEIYFDRGEKYGCGSPGCKPGCDCDRYMEIWNNVFSQFNNDGNGHYTELAQKNIDTGMGLERLACVMQGVDNMFEVDTIRNIIETVSRISGKTYGDDAQTDISIRIVTDHIRSSVFMISDGVIPSNEGRGYVLRRIIRRGCRNGKLLGIQHPFLCDLCDVVIADNENAYPELKDKAAYIRKILSVEEERFDATVDAGLSILADLVRDAKAGNRTVISGDDVFKLYDTYGFPPDLTEEILTENGLSSDGERFRERMAEQKNMARRARANISGWSDAAKTALSHLPKTDFRGYTETECTARVVAVLVDNEPRETVNEGECSVVLDATVCYGEGGGQVGDTGRMTKPGCELTVTDTKKADGVYLHLCTVTEGSLSVGDTVTVSYDYERRQAIRRNHSAAHLLQAALRRTLGTHAEQAGSYVDEHIMRFDFTHFAALTAEELEKVENLINNEILKGDAIVTTETDPETARRMGAMALFGEKYGSVVRVVKMGDFSCELCGGTHEDNTAKVGLFRITSESSVAAGTRRIEAVTGQNVMTLLRQKETVLARTAAILKTNERELTNKAEALTAEVRTLEKKVAELNGKLSESKLDEILRNVRETGGVKIVTARLDADADTLHSLCDKLRTEHPDMAVLLAAVADGKVTLAAGVGKDALKNGAHAGNMIREAAKLCGGGGGGRPDSATAGGRDASRLDEAFEAFAAALSR